MRGSGMHGDVSEACKSVENGKKTPSLINPSEEGEGGEWSGCPLRWSDAVGVHGGDRLGVLGMSRNLCVTCEL